MINILVMLTKVMATYSVSCGFGKSSVSCAGMGAVSFRGFPGHSTNFI